MTECHFWANLMLIQSRVQASRASPAQKSQGLRVVYSKKISRATFFVFWVTLLVDIYLSYLPVKQIWWKSAVCYYEKKLFYWSRKTFEIRGWRPRICKNFEITRIIYSNSERSEQCLVTECFFNLFLEVSHI